MRASLERLAKGLRGTLLSRTTNQAAALSAKAMEPWPPPWFAALLQLEEDAPPGDAAIEALHTEMAERAGRGGAATWSRMQLSNLRMANKNAPEWWVGGSNLLLAAPGAKVRIDFHMYGLEPASNCLVIVGDGVLIRKVMMAGEGGILAVGDACNFHSSQFALIGCSTILIGENSTSTFEALVDSRNGGAIVVGADNMWAHGVIVATDDDHAIRDVKTSKRLNIFGGNIVIEPHVWLGGDVRIFGNSRIGTHTVVGQGAFVKSELPAHSICVGRPARAVRSGVTWTREDLP